MAWVNAFDTGACTVKVESGSTVLFAKVMVKGDSGTFTLPLKYPDPAPAPQDGEFAIEVLADGSVQLSADFVYPEFIFPSRLLVRVVPSASPAVGANMRVRNILLHWYEAGLSSDATAFSMAVNSDDFPPDDDGPQAVHLSANGLTVDPDPAKLVAASAAEWDVMMDGRG